MTSPPGYHLARRHHGGALLGLTPAQVVLLSAGISALVTLPVITGSATGLLAGAVIAMACVAGAFVPVDGRPLHLFVPILAGFLLTLIRRRTRWLSPLAPPTTAAAQTSRHRRPSPAASRSAGLPPCLAGLDLHAQARPGWAGSASTHIGLISDRQARTLTAVLTIRGGPFALLEPAEQHAAVRGWGNVLNQFGRETSPLVRLGWSLWSAPAATSQPRPAVATAPGGISGRFQPQLRRAGQDYQRLLAEKVTTRHELRVWISVHAVRGRRGTDTAAQAAVAAAQALTERCTAAGLVVTEVLSPQQIAHTLSVYADPYTNPAPDPDPAQAQPSAGPADVAGASIDLAGAAPMAVHRHWDYVQIDGAFHRSFFVARWPATVTSPGWLHELLHTPTGIRTITVTYEPIPVRVSRRRITADAVSLDSQLQMRQKHDFRIGVDLQRAQADIDQRDAELSAGWCEYAHLTLITLTAPTRHDLDRNSQALLDQGAQCGITDLRALHARHDRGWAATLPFGRTPDHELFTGGRS